jgi:hypothetical protein
MSIGSYSRGKLETIIRNVSTAATPEGEITGVTAGNGLTGGGTSGTVTVSVDIASATDGTGVTVSNSDQLLLSDADDSDNVKKINISQLPSAATSPGGSDTQIQYNNGSAFGGVSSLTYNDSTGHLTIIDDKKLYFGSGNEVSLEYDEDGNDTLSISGDTLLEDAKKLYFGSQKDAFIWFDETADTHLVISGSSDGIVLSGSTIHIDGILYGASPLKIGSEIEFESNANNRAMRIKDNQSLTFGTSRDSQIKFVDAGGEQDPHFVISGSDAGVVISGSAVKVDAYLGIGVNLESNAITHGITLPNINGVAGRIKAAAYTTYSSIRYKNNVEPIQKPLETLSKLKGVTFNWKKDNSSDIGFIAEEVGKHLPHIVDWEKGSSYAQSMDYSKIVPLLVESIKSQQKQIDTLQTEIESLKKI